MTRIVAGSAGGRRLRVPPRGTRPTSERVREAVFSALESAGRIAAARVLDLYAGSGALGLEALSRGAAGATFVESDGRAAALIRSNAADLGLTGQVLRGKVTGVLADPPAAPFDLVLADPPYGCTELGTVLRLLTAGWLAPGAVLVVEVAARDGDPPWPPGITPGRTRRYGDTAVHWGQAAE